MVVWGLKELSGQLGRLLVGDAIVLGDVYRYAAGGILSAVQVEGYAIYHVGGCISVEKGHAIGAPL